METSRTSLYTRLAWQVHALGLVGESRSNHRRWRGIVRPRCRGRTSDRDNGPVRPLLEHLAFDALSNRHEGGTLEAAHIVGRKALGIAFHLGKIANDISDRRGRFCGATKQPA